MVEYFTLQDVPGRTYFNCERMRAKLSTDACAAMWRKADAATDGTNNSCKLCPIGAVHAGEVAASMSPLKGSLICARCHRQASRLIGKHLCVSCKNREYELLKGRNAKGTAPVKTSRLDCRVLRYSAGGDLRYLRLPLSIDMDELVVATLRDNRNKVEFGFMAPKPVGLVQGSLW
jgi:hypothetical protein